MRTQRDPIQSPKIVLGVAERPRLAKTALRGSPPPEEKWLLRSRRSWSNILLTLGVLFVLLKEIFGARFHEFADVLNDVDGFLVGGLIVLMGLGVRIWSLIRPDAATRTVIPFARYLDPHK